MCIRDSVQTEVTPNPNSLKFLPGKNVSNSGPYEITNKDQINNELITNILSINGVEGVFLGQDFLSVNKSGQTKWEEIKHIVISFIFLIFFDAILLAFSTPFRRIESRYDWSWSNFFISSDTGIILLTDIKSFPKKILSTPLTDKIFLSNSLFI